MTASQPAQVVKQHLIDPEVCIRCNTCEETCPIDAITHDSNNYVVNVDICRHCMACVGPCPTGAIDNWLMVMSDKAYSLDDQFGWDELPAQEELDEPGPDFAETPPQSAPAAVAVDGDALADLDGMPSTSAGASIPPRPAGHPSDDRKA